MVDNGHDRIGSPRLVRMIECLEAILDVVKSHHRVAEMWLVTVQDASLELCLVSLKGHTMVREFNARWFLAIVLLGLSLDLDSLRCLTYFIPQIQLLRV